MSQSLTQLWVHIIFSTKERYPYLKNKNIQAQMHNYLKSICQNKKCFGTMVGGVEDHVHILTSINKSLSTSELVEELKRSSSKWIKTLGDNQFNKFYWQSGYGAFSVSESMLEKVKVYIANQEQHHRKMNFKDELIHFFKQHNVVFDEKYLWS